MLSQREYEEFNRVIRSSRYSPDDFEISAIDFVDRCSHVYPDSSRVYVTYKPTSITRSYLAGFACYWLRNFQKDIENKVFTAVTEVLEKRDTQR